MILLQLIKFGAVLPVWCKRSFVEKVFIRILNIYRNRNKRDLYIYSNLGMNNRLRVKLSVHQSPAQFFFGTPDSYPGESYTLHLAEALNKYCSAFVDIGANWGYYSYYMALTYKKPIYWFEPNPVLYSNVTSNIKYNNFNNVIGSDTAISDAEGQLTFYIDQSSDLQSSLINPGSQANVKEHTVQSMRFDNWVSSGSIPDKLLVKVDVENAEWNFINGAKDNLGKVQFLILEVLGPARQTGFINFMIRELGFHAYYINENKIEHVKEEDMRYTKGEYNWLFCKYQPLKLEEYLSGSRFTVTA
jgi:FkbM family methyltransferase